MSFQTQGTVRDQNNVPISGAQIFETANPDNGTQSDENGNFQFLADDDVMLCSVTAPGMQTITEDADGLNGTVTMYPIGTTTAQKVATNPMFWLLIVLVVVVVIEWKYISSLLKIKM